MKDFGLKGIDEVFQPVKTAMKANQNIFMKKKKQVKINEVASPTPKRKPTMIRAATTDSNLLLQLKPNQTVDKKNKEETQKLIKQDTKQILNKNVSLASVNSINLEEILKEEEKKLDMNKKVKVEANFNK